MKRLLAICMMLLLAPCLGDSLLPEDPQDYFAPTKIRVGDLVTVVIQDSVRTTQQVQVKNEDSSGITNPISTLVGTVTGITPNHKDTADRNEQANTQSNFQQTITATVVAVEGENLALQAATRITLDGKQRKVSLTGKVRRRDVGADNRVSSQLVADAVIEVDGLHKSPVQPGIMSRILRFLF